MTATHLADGCVVSLPTMEGRILPESGTFWASMRPEGRPNFSKELLRDLMGCRAEIRRLHTERKDPANPPFDFFVLDSKVPGVYNLGGDLSLFAEHIRSGDKATLQGYAYACIDLMHGTSVGFGLPLTTITVVQGEALGGGFECALSHDVIVAERSARMGLPEILFNLFPGMGAYSFLSRKAGRRAAEMLITSGKVHDAEELHALGVVDILAEDGEGAQAALDYIRTLRRKRNASRTLLDVRRRLVPIPFDELRDIVDIWVDAALNVSDLDLRLMDRLTGAQNRRWSAQPATAN